ncbi:hypothetical protein [Undibacter mobilis]|uniref:Uncharacterized protein n=1 Tax=Undibacter mobilis TaxID=2292256 RepID=A0A371BD84_9BRAD|nr:hypothetical protein [Undibacter mobilis]RDV05552.1 hypothetical protein DXH78_13795 [Undibacter mobilis]
MSMTEIDIVTAPEDAGAAVSWHAIIAGAATAAAITLILVAFGVGVGFSVISPWSGQGVSASTFTIGGGIFLIVVAMLSSTIGGYIAGRLRPQWGAVHSNERYFRDSAHGLVTWAVATLAVATILGGAMTAIVGTTGAGLAVAGSQPADMYVDALLRTNPANERPATAVPADAQQQATTPVENSQIAPTLQGGQLPARTGIAVNRASIARLIAPAMIKGGSITDPDRTYLTQLVATQTGLPEAQARQRVDQIITQAQTAADKARKSSAAAAFWLAFALLASALAASLAAIEGGNLRNRAWWTDARGRVHTAPAE